MEGAQHRLHGGFGVDDEDVVLGVGDQEHAGARIDAAGPADRGGEADVGLAGMTKTPSARRWITTDVWMSVISSRSPALQSRAATAPRSCRRPPASSTAIDNRGPLAAPGVCRDGSSSGTGDDNGDRTRADAGTAVGRDTDEIGRVMTHLPGLPYAGRARPGSV
ncbi:hypothetical protein ED92_38550 [Amycolatopsis sp. MJM2582]|nr:hypothetical protein ED92_38550 [Amycolatopsis sp. MJM2582]